MKRLLTIIACAILLALVCIQLFFLYVDPSQRFFSSAMEASDSWAFQIHANERPIYVFAGGSEVRSGVDPRIFLDEFNMPMVNAGVAAGNGLQANVALSCKYLKPGDTLVLSILSTNERDIVPSASGIKMAVYRLDASVLDSGIMATSARTAAQFLASDAHAFFILLARAIKPSGYLFKYYEQTIIHPSGWMEILYREMDGYKPTKVSVPNHLQQLDKNGVCASTLQKLQEYCTQKNVRLIVCIPPRCNPDALRAQYAMTALCITRLGIPVLKDERLGCLPVPTNFADTPAHLNTEAVAENTRIIARLLQKNSFWTEQELVDFLHSAGYQPDGTPQQ